MNNVKERNEALKAKFAPIRQDEYEATKNMAEERFDDLSDNYKELYSQISDVNKSRKSYDMLKYKFPKNWSSDINKERIDDLLIHAAQNKVNDVIIKTGSPIRAKIDGKIYFLTNDNIYLSNQELTIFADCICGKTYYSSFGQSKAYDTSYTIKRETVDADGNHKILYYAFRVNAHRTAGGMEITMRLINDYPFRDPTIPKVIREIFRSRNGIILIVGATGTGKSSFLASNILDKIEDPSISCRILTLESPIEFNFDRVIQWQTFVTQAEVPRDIVTFEKGIEATLRRAPDDLLVGEMRDYETISAGLLAATTGMLVYSTMHVNRVADTISRILETTRDPATTSRVISMLRMICSQDLLQKIGGGRIAVREYLIFDKKISDFLSEKIHESEKLNLILDELTYNQGVHFQVHARFLYLNKQISHETFIGFMKSRLFDTSEENLKKLDKRIIELQQENNEMFIYTTDNPVPMAI